MGVYLLLGDDEERRARGVERLRRDRAAESYDASETGPEAVVSACNSYSLFGEGVFVLVQNLEQPTGKALVRWVVGHAKNQGLDLPDDVARDLIERCSGNKIRLITETEKLALYVGEDAATHEDVEALC